MFQVSPEDVLRGLKRFKRLAKQDILASSKTPNPQFWTLQAEARRKTYDLLMETIENQGLDAAFELARSRFASLPATEDSSEDPDTRGQRQAFSLFFKVLGVDHEQHPAESAETPAGDPPLAVNARS